MGSAQQKVGGLMGGGDYGRDGSASGDPLARVLDKCPDCQLLMNSGECPKCGYKVSEGVAAYKG
jgi:hypothetical protein